MSDREDQSELESLIYGAGQMYVPVGAIFLLTGYASGNVSLIFVGISIFTFVLYLYFILYKDIYRRR